LPWSFDLPEFGYLYFAQPDAAPFALGAYDFSYVLGATTGKDANGVESYLIFNGTGALTIEELATSVPEPATGALALLALGGAGAALWSRRRHPAA
jgi:hypothetical protein